VLALRFGAQIPAIETAIRAGLLGFVGYGLSLTLFVIALRHLGTARTGAYFSLAPFIGAALSVAWGAPLTGALLLAALFMGAGVWLHISENHAHLHRHSAIEHEHWHVHDEHHQHQHADGTHDKESHSHVHVHDSLEHAHPHYPDVHHRHEH
jgi:hypothetical protein